MFNNTLKKLKEKGGDKYSFILKAGNSLHKALYRLFEVVWKVEKIPSSWRETVIIQIPKGNAEKHDLDFKRNIHTKDQIPKAFSHIVMTAMKPIIQENISKFQIGAIPGHRSEEHLFTLKSIAALAEKNDVAIAANLLDFPNILMKKY